MTEQTWSVYDGSGPLAVEGDASDRAFPYDPDHGSTQLVVGNWFGIVNINAFLRFDPTIPLGSTINKAKLTLIGDATDGGSFAAELRALLRDGLWDQSLTEFPEPHWLGNCEIKDTGGSGLGAAGTLNQATSSLDVQNLGRNGVGQIILATASGTLGSAEWRLRRLGAYPLFDPGKSVWFEIWSVTGSATDYRSGTKLAESEKLPIGDVWAVWNIHSIAFLGADQIAISSGTRYALILRTDSVNIGRDAPAIQAAFEGSLTAYDEHALVRGAPSHGLAGFGTGLNLANVTALSSAQAVTMGAVTAGNTYVIGNAAYSPDFEVDLAAALQEVVDHATWAGSGPLLLKLYPSGSPGAVERSFRSGDHATGPAPQLTIDWTAPGASDISIRGKPRVQSRITGRPAMQPRISGTLRVRSTISARAQVRGDP